MVCSVIIQYVWANHISNIWFVKVFNFKLLEISNFIILRDRHQKLISMCNDLYIEYKINFEPEH